MADGVTFQSATLATPPSGTVASTDEVTIGGLLGQVQRVKLVDGTDGGTGLIGGDAANGLDVDVTRLPALATGDNTAGRVKLTDGTTVATVRDLAANDALNVAIVDGAGAQITSFGGGTQYTEADTDASITGTAMLWEDTADTLRAVSATKPLPVGDAGGSLTVDAASLPLPTGASTLAEQQTQTTSLAAIESDVDALRISSQLIDDTINTLGTATYTEATTRGALVAVVRRDADTSPVNTDNEIGPLTMDANGRLKVEVFDGGDSHTVDGTVAVSTLPALVAGSANIGDVDVLSVPAPLSTSGGGTEATALRVTVATDSTGVLSVDDNAGSLTIDQATAANLNAQVVGNIAHDTAASGNPVTTAGSHETPADSAPTNRLASVTDGDVQRFSTVDGALFVVPGGPQQWSARLTGAMTDTTVKAAPGTGLSLYITTVVYSIGAATASSILLEESTTTAKFGPHYLEAINGRGLAVTFGTPIKIAANTLLSATSTGATTNTLDVYGFTAPG